MKKNKFSKALNHLKSKKLDEKIKKLEEAAPTNNMSGIYQQSPRADAAFRLGELDPPKRFVAAADGSWPAGIPGTPGEPYYDRPAGYFKGTVDWETVTSPKFGYESAQGNNTDGLIDPVTNVVKTQLPPNSRSFILGPLVDGFVPNHISDAFTRIGYIEKDTRQFVLLASFTGEWIAGLNGYNGVPTWNGTSTGFTQVNPNFTLDMALWFRNEMLKGRYVKNVSYNAVGGIPQPQFSDPDAPQPLGGNGVGGGSGTAGDNPDGTGAGVGSGGEPNAGTPQGDPDPGKDPGQNNLWGMGARRRRNRRGSGARGNRGRRKPDPTPSPTPTPQGGRGGGQGNPTNQRGSGARGNRGSGSTPSPTPTGGRTPDPQGGRGGGTGNPTNQRGSGARGNRGSGSTPSPTPTPQGGRGGGTGNPTNRRGSGARGNRGGSTPSPTPTGGFTPTPQGGRGGGQGNPTNQRGSGAGSAPSWASQTANNISNSLRNSVPAAVGRAIRSLTDPFRYAGSLMFQGNPAGRAPGLSNYWSPNPVTAGGYTGKGGGFPGKGPTASGTITSAPRPTNTPRVSRSPLGQPQFKFPKGSGGVRGMVTQTADNAAVSALGRRAASTLGRRLGRFVPFVGAGIAVADATSRIRNGDYGGAILSGLSAIPGPLGWIALGTQMVTDGFGATGNRREEYIIETKTKDTFKDDLQNMGGFDIEKGDWGAAFMDELAKSTEIEDDEKAIIAAVFSGEDEGLMITDLQEVLGKIMARIANKESEGKKPEVQESYTASKKRILREISQPLKEIKELPKTTKLKGYKPNFKGKFTPQNTPDVTSSKKSDRLVMAKNAEGQLWSVGDKYFKGWETTNRMNHVYSRVGESDKFFEQITANNSADVDRKMQEHLNHVYHNKAMLKIDSNYESPFGDNIDEQETYDNKINDPLFTKVAKRLKKEIDYEKKPAKVGYPNEAPPKIDPNTGMHPKFGKKYKYDKLDPISAKTMAGAPTGDPEIDANVKKAAKIKESWRSDLKNLWIGSEREDWKKKIKEDFANTTQGMKVGQTFTHVPSGQTVTTSGVLGGIETLQTSVELFGDAIPGPTESQYGLQGFAKPIDMMRRGNKKTEELNKKLDSSEQYTKEIKADEYMKARLDEMENELDKLKKILDEKEKIYKDIQKRIDKLEKLSEKQSKKISKMRDDGLKKIDAKYDERQKVRDRMVRKFEASFPSLTYTITGSMQIKDKADSDRYYKTEGDFYKKVDATWDSMTKKIDAERKAFLEKMNNLNQSTVGKYNQEIFSLQQYDLPRSKYQYEKALKNHSDKFIEYSELNQQENMIKGLIDELTGMVSSYFRRHLGGGLPLPVEMTLRYAMGNMDPMTNSPGTLFNALTMPAIMDAYKSGRFNVMQKDYDGLPEQVSRAMLNRFNYEITPNGIRVMDTFNFDDPENGGANIGAFAEIPTAQWIATQLVKAGDRKARSRGIDPRDDRFGIKVNYIIPKSDMTPEQIKLFYGKSKAVQKIKGLAGGEARKELSLDEPVISPKKKNFREWSQQLDDMWNSDWRDELKEGMTTSDTFSYSVSGKGDVDLSITGTGYTEDGVHQLQDIEPMINVDDPHNVGKRFGKTHGYGGNTYGGISQYDSASKEAQGIENHYWMNPVTGDLDNNTNPRYSDYIYPFDRDATQAEIETATAASRVKGRNDSFRAVYPTNTFGTRHKVPPVVTNPTVGTDDDYDTVGLGLQFGRGTDTRAPLFFVPNPVNTSEIDTVQILASLPQADSITSAGTQLQLFYWSGDKPGFQSLYPANPGDYPRSNQQYDGWRPISMKPNGETDSSVNNNLIDIEKPIGYEVGKVSKFSVQIPEWVRSNSTRFMFVQIRQNGSMDRLRIYKIGYQRRNALTINTTLADEKASAFVRVGNNSQMAPEERKKKLNDMLKASREYMLKSLGFASLFNDEVKISDVVSNDLDFGSVIQGDGKYGNATFHDIIDHDKKVAAQKKATRSAKQRSRTTAYKRSFESIDHEMKGEKLFEKLKDRKIIKEGMTTQALTGILPSTGEADLVNLQTGLTGDGGIDYGQSGVNDSTLTGEGEYTGLSVMGDITTVEDPTGVGPWFRHRDFDFGDNPSKQSMHGGTYASSSAIGVGAIENQIPGYVPASFRGVRLTGDYSSGFYVNRFGFTDDTLGLPSGAYNSNDGVTRKGYGTALEFPDSGWIATKDIDTTEVDTLKIHARVSDVSVSHLTSAGDQTEVYYWAGNKPGFKSVSGDTISGSDGIGVGKPNDGWRPLNQKPDGSFDNTVSTVLIGPVRASNTNNVLQAHTIKLPDWATGPKSRYIIISKGQNNKGTFSMTSIRFQRKSAKRVRTLMKPLSDVESSPFVRVGPTKKNEGGKERKKKVQNIIRSGLKYTGKKFSKDFPVRTDLE